MVFSLCQRGRTSPQSQDNESGHVLNGPDSRPNSCRLCQTSPFQGHQFLLIKTTYIQCCISIIFHSIVSCVSTSFAHLLPSFDIFCCLSTICRHLFGVFRSFSSICRRLSSSFTIFWVIERTVSVHSLLFLYFTPKDLVPFFFIGPSNKTLFKLMGYPYYSLSTVGCSCLFSRPSGE